MSRSLVIAACCWAVLAGSASAADDPPSRDGRPGATAAETPDRKPVKQVALDPTAPQPVCRRYVPTGSRIAEERCEMRGSDKAGDAHRAQTRRDLDEMRARQTMRDQVRAQAAEALRRR